MAPAISTTSSTPEPGVAEEELGRDVRRACARFYQAANSSRAPTSRNAQLPRACSAGPAAACSTSARPPHGSFLSNDALSFSSGLREERFAAAHCIATSIATGESAGLPRSEPTRADDHAELTSGCGRMANGMRCGCRSAQDRSDRGLGPLDAAREARGVNRRCSSFSRSRK